MIEVNSNLNEILIFTGYFGLPAFAFIGYLLWTSRCPKGWFHKYKTTNGRFVKGNDIGFGITNSFTHQTCKCEKCGHSFETFN